MTVYPYNWRPYIWWDFAASHYCSPEKSTRVRKKVSFCALICCCNLANIVKPKNESNKLHFINFRFPTQNIQIWHTDKWMVFQHFLGDYGFSKKTKEAVFLVFFYMTLRKQQNIFSGKQSWKVGCAKFF